MKPQQHLPTIATAVSLCLLKPLSMRPLLLGAALALLPLLSHAWWNPDWTERTRITLNTSAGGLPTQEAVTGLVVPLRLHSGNFEFVAAKEDGSDLRVIGADDKTPLPFTVERFDGLNELAVLWVRLPAVQPGSDQNVVHVYAGNPKAAVEPPAAAGAVFGSDTLVFHFAENTGPAADLGGTVRSGADVPREPNGLLGTSGSLGGEAIAWPAGAIAERVPVPAGSALTVALWVRPDNPNQGSLLRWGPLALTLVNGQVQVELGRQKFAGGSLPPATWAQVALVADAGKLALFVNGQKAGEAAATLPALDGRTGTLQVGAGLRGLVDELQIVAAARSADALRLAAAAQGGDGKLIASVKETAGDAAEDAGAEHGYLGILVKNLTVDAWVVIIILAVMFAVAVWVMFAKAFLLGRTDRDNRSFLTRFRAATQDLLKLETGAAHPHSSLFRLYKAGMRELNKREVGVKDVALSGASIDAVKAAVDADLVRENHRLNAQMVLLTIAISGGPFLGLLGTVVGVMITFAAIAAAGDVNVNAIAPGIAAALLATVAGLAVAIPALFGYNWLAARIKNISADMQIFVDEFITLVAERYGQR
jgi:biopolymer transport protein ExbB